MTLTPAAAPACCRANHKLTLEDIELPENHPFAVKAPVSGQRILTHCYMPAAVYLVLRKELVCKHPAAPTTGCCRQLPCTRHLDPVSHA